MPIDKRIKPLNDDETKWIRKLEKILLACPSLRIGLVTVGDNWLHVIDAEFVRKYDIELHDGLAEKNGVVLDTVRSRPQIAGVSG